VLERALGGLLPSSEEGAPVEAPEQPLDAAEQAALELPLLSGNLRSLVAKTWPNVRVAVLTQFGALTVGPRAAIQRANAYYGQLVRARLLGKESHTLVHPRLQSALDAATIQLRHRWSFLPPEEQEAIEAATQVRPPAWWGTNVRENRNARHKLSDHSFGWAIDFQAAKNPNVGKSGALDPVLPVTEDDPRAAKRGGTSDEVEATAEELRRISREYVAAMESRETLEPVLLRIANEARGTAAPLTSGTALLDAAIMTKAKERDKALLAALWPEQAAPPASVKAAVKTLALIGAAFRTSFVQGKIGGDRVKAATEAKPGTVAAHGFMDLPPALVAALAGSDAGGLVWLGTASVADFMHFQLAEAPPLYTDEPVTADEAHGVAAP
jgi:hypothetical protein